MPFDFKIEEVREDKKRHLDLLLLGDEQEDMVDRYLARGTLYILREEETVKALCVVTDEGDGVLEVKNIAVVPSCQRKGYGRAMLAFVEARYKGAYTSLQVGTGDSPLTLPFYERCGFQRAHTVKNFFLDHYDHPIFEAGKQLVDMIYLKKSL